jgi:seryl-tRNA synthetase
MGTEPENTTSPDPFEALNAVRDSSLKTWNTMRDASLESWSKLMIELVNSDAYSRTTAQGLDSYLTLSQPFQQLIDMTTTQVLTKLNMPQRADVTQIAERLTNIEIRLDDLDAKLDEIQHAITALAAPKHATSTAKTKGAH